MEGWRSALNGDPLDWLLERDMPSVRHLALRWLLHEPDDAPSVRRARSAAMKTGPIATTLAAQHPEGYWVTPGAGYGPKYTGTVWSLIFLDQLGADGRDPRVSSACRYVLDHTQAPNGGFGWRATDGSVVHCLNGNVLRALIGFGWFDDARVQASIDHEARTITGEGIDTWHPSTTSGPGFACGINGGLPCAWGAVKGLRGLDAVPPRRRTRRVRRAIADGTAFLLSRDPAVADYPTDTTVSPNWFKLGFPSGYVADVLQNVEVLCELGYAKDPHLVHAIELVLSKQDRTGRWRNEYPYRGKTWGDLDARGKPSKWVTLRACRVLEAALG